MSACSPDAKTNITGTGSDSSDTGATDSGEPGSAQSDVPRNTTPDASPAELEAMRLGEWAFAQELYGEVTATDDVSANDNFALSPYSLRSALAMAWAGAVDTTESEMAEVLRFSLGQARTHNAMNQVDLALERRNDEGDEDNPPVVLAVNNRFFVHYDIEVSTSYLDVLAFNYGADVKLVDFRDGEPSRNLINQWVADQTHARIPELLPIGSIQPLTPIGGTISVLINTLYLTAPWAVPFDEDATEARLFTDRDGQQLSVAMMYAEAMHAHYAQVGGFEAVELPLRLGQLGLTLVLPPVGGNELDTWIDPDQLQALFGAYVDTHVELSVPKFEIAAAKSLVLKEPFVAMGMEAPFQGGFDNAYPGGGVFIDDIYHQVFFAVDEDGVEGAAATAVVSGIGFAPSDPPVADYTVTFDRPFLMILRDRASGTILFMGRVTQPTPA